MIVENHALAEELALALESLKASSHFIAEPTASLFEIVRSVERQKPDLLFVEMARVPGAAQHGVIQQWMDTLKAAGDVVVAVVHPNAEPEQMIAAMRAGASEFISLPVRPAIFDAMDRIATILESRRTQTVQPGAITGILSAKGGCGATTLACNLALAARRANPSARVLIADLDHQAPGAHRLLRLRPRRQIAEAFDSARRLSSGTWSDFVCRVEEGVDLLAGSQTAVEAAPEAWRIDNLFRFVTRHYNHIIVDLGRNLNPHNWTFLQPLDELIVVTAPDVLALYQTRQILQTLSSRGFDRQRVRLILNRNHVAPQDFWVESIEQMFEIGVMEVIPNEYHALNSMPSNRFEFAAGTQFGKTLLRLAGKIAGAPKPANEGGKFKF